MTRLPGPLCRASVRDASHRDVGNCLIKAQVGNPKTEDDKPLGRPAAIDPHGALYLMRNVHEAEQVETTTPNRAKRYIEKRLLRDL